MDVSSTGSKVAADCDGGLSSLKRRARFTALYRGARIRWKMSAPRSILKLLIAPLLFKKHILPRDCPSALCFFREKNRLRNWRTNVRQKRSFLYSPSRPPFSDLLVRSAAKSSRKSIWPVGNQLGSRLSCIAKETTWVGMARSRCLQGGRRSRER